MFNEKIKKIADFVRSHPTGSIGHGWDHVDRVREWALKIAQAESYPDRDLIEATALLHDIARDDQKEDHNHGLAGAEMAKNFLIENQLFSPPQIAEICQAIRYHNTYRGGSGKLLEILKDADRLDLLGATGILRGATHNYSKPLYDPQNVRGAGFKKTLKEFNVRLDQGLDAGDFISDQLNFQVSCYYDLYTKSAKRFGKPLVKYLQKFILELEKEVKSLE